MNEEFKVIISAEVGKLKKGMGEAKQSVKGFAEQVKNSKQAADENLKALGSSIGNGLKTAATAGATAIAGLGASLLALGASTAEYRNEQAKLQTAFETAGGSASQATTTYNDLYRVLGDGGQATEAAAHLAKLTTNQKDLGEWTTIATGVYATFGDSLPIEGLTEAANETAKTGALTGGLADALNWAGVSEEAFQEKLDACNTEAERESLIRETLNGLYSDAAKNYEKNNADVLAQNEAQAKLDATLASVGATMAPVITLLTNLAGDVLAKLQPYIQSFAENYLPVIKDVLAEVGTHLQTAFTWLSEHKGILAVMAGIIGGIVAAIGLYNVVAAVKAAMDVAQVTTLGALIAAQLASAAATIVAIAPYLAIVAAIAAVIAIVVLCVKHWDTIKEKVVEIANKIKEKIVEMKESVVAKFTELKNNITTKVDELKNKFLEKVQMLKDKALEIFNKIKTSLLTPITTAKDLVLGTVDKLKTAFYEKVLAVKTAVTTVFNQVKTAITNPVEAAKNTVSGIIEKIKGFFNFNWSLPKLKMPHLNISGEFSLAPPKVPKFSIDWYAQGGIFDKPTLFPYGNGAIGGLGEAGAEAIVPLEKNTQWLDRIAERLQGGKQPIYLNVDGKTFAEISVESINQLTRQRGSLPLVLV